MMGSVFAWFGWLGGLAIAAGLVMGLEIHGAAAGLFGFGGGVLGWLIGMAATPS